MNEQIDLFPQGYATQAAFCNREKEREYLKQAFRHHQHTVIVAPRRYGKTSLILQVLLEMDILGQRIDFLPATNVMFVNKAVKKCFLDLMNEVAPKTKTARLKLFEFIKNLHPKLTLNVLGQQLEVSSSQLPENSIIDLLESLNNAAKKINKKIVLCFDEFQQIGLLKNNHSIEAAIRHAVESSSHITYVFSGSSRHLLNQMFSSKNRPLYHLCELMVLDRIDYATYLNILLFRAEKRWSTKIHPRSIDEILTLTRCHPYYVNALCRHLWASKKFPEVHEVQGMWFKYVETQSNWITDDLARLSPIQRNILAALAYLPTSEPFGNAFSERVKIGSSSIKKSLDVLLKEDFVYQLKSKEYRVLDPAMETYLLKIRNFDFVDE